MIEKSTLILRPSTSMPVSSFLASVASFTLSKYTKEKPLDFPVLASKTTWTFSKGPYFSNID